MKNKRWLVQVNENGQLVIPASLSRKMGLYPGASLVVQENPDSLLFSRPANSIARVNIELTNQCNLNCLTCMRNTWEEQAGMMEDAVFERILDGIKQINPVPMVFFGGFGEPLLHARVIDWISAAKTAGARVELITNATLLDDRLARRVDRCAA